VTIPADGPYYDDLAPGLVFPSPPAVTIDSGLAAAYQAISGDALALCLDARLSARVTGAPTPLASPGLVLHLSIGASTVATKRVIANLFYRNVRLSRPVFRGETLHTVTRVEAMADAAPKEGQRPRGKALLGIVTSADDDAVLDYQRCPLLPCRGDTAPGHAGEIGGAETTLSLARYADTTPAWDLGPLGDHDAWTVGSTRADPLRDVVDNATALVRLTHNQAAVHRDVEVSPYPVRLVYGGHTVALAQASLGRVLGGLATVLGWHSCDHLGPVFEGDLLSCRHTLVDEQPAPHGSGLVRAVRVEVDAHRPDGAVKVLDWTPVLYTT
jgi:2-methylfumaryl-CoA hydratase